MLKSDVRTQISPLSEDDPLMTNVVKMASQVRNTAKDLNFFQKGATRIAAIAAIHKITTRL